MSEIIIFRAQDDHKNRPGLPSHVENGVLDSSVDHAKKDHVRLSERVLARVRYFLCDS